VGLYRSLFWSVHFNSNNTGFEGEADHSFRQVGIGNFTPA
jgi:hypothetical protein